MRFFEKWSAAYADRVIVSDGIHYKKILESRGIPGDKITVILNVPDEEIFARNAPVSTKNGHYFRLIIVSTIIRRYGVQTAIKAVPLMVKQIPNLMVDIIGEGEFLPELRRMVREMGIDEHVTFLGLVPHDDGPPFIAQSNIGLAPMIDDVGLPNKLFEYFAMNKPSVVSAHPSLVGAFEHKRAVAFFEPGNEKDLADRIVELYQDPQKQDSLVTEASDFYRNCRWSIIKADYLKVYEDLLKK
jgi:glycosyltransferase involved in cell wall biosynthesis